MIAFVASNAQANDEIKGYYWIDTGKPEAMSSYIAELPVGNLRDGFHSFNFVAYSADGKYSAQESVLFVKVPETMGSDTFKSTVLIDGAISDAVYITPSTENASTYQCIIDANKLTPGLHSMQFTVHSVSGVCSEAFQAWFIRVPTEEELSSTKVSYFIDGRHIGTYPLSKDGSAFVTGLDMSWLQTGMHSIDISLVLSDGSLTSYAKSWFYRSPIPTGVVAYDYWFDDHTNNLNYISLADANDDLGIMSMIDIPEIPFDSRKYEFSVIDGIPSIKEAHTLNMRFYESDGRALTATSDFVETRREYALDRVDNLAEGVNKIDRRAENEIRWFSFDGEVGDSISLSLSRAGMLEFYSPNGDALLRLRSSHAEATTSYTLRETGKYYVAAHDVDGDRTAPVNLNFHHVPRNAILSVTPEKADVNNRFTLFEIFGNGMNDVKSFAITSKDGIRFETDTIVQLDNYHLWASLTATQDIPCGIYDVSLLFADKLTGEDVIVSKSDAITFTGTACAPEISVDVVPSKKASTPYMVDIVVTNKGDVPCWGIPLNVACERDGGKNGYIFYISDFLGKNISTNDFKYYETDNLLNTGKDGILFPLTIGTLQPGQTKTLKVGIKSEPHKKVGLYAWVGQPYSEECKQILAMPEDSLKNMRVMQSNLMNLRMAALILGFIDSFDNNEETHTMRVQARAPTMEDVIIESAEDLAVDAVGHYSPNAGRAINVGQRYVAIGQVLSFIINLGYKGNTAVTQLRDNCGYRGTPQEIIRQIEAEFPGVDQDLAKIPDTQAQIRYWYAELKNAMANIVPPEDIFVDNFFPTNWKIARRLWQYYQGRNAESDNPMPTRHNIDVYMSGDPNMLTGYTDPSGGTFIGLHISNLDYIIEFENDPEIASAAASTVVVEDTLDGNAFELDSFATKKITLGSKEITVPAQNDFVVTVDMRPEIECIAEIRQSYSPETGYVKWTFTSLDPMTLQPVNDFRQGLLPVNDSSGRGIGTIDYSVTLKSGLAHGTTISNKATIVFDNNDAIDTPVWSNVTDYERPVARITEQQNHSDGSIEFTVESSDSGSGVMHYNLYALFPGNNDWRVIKSGLSDASVIYEPTELIPNTQYTVLATDNAGNKQVIESNPSTDIHAVFNDEPINDADSLWYDINGVRVRSKSDVMPGKLIISNKGRKIIVK